MVVHALLKERYIKAVRNGYGDRKQMIFDLMAVWMYKRRLWYAYWSYGDGTVSDDEVEMLFDRVKAYYSYKA